MSKSLSPKNKGLSTYEKECLVVLMAVEKWRSYLHHQELLIRPDQESLVHMEEQQLTTVWQQKAFTKLLGLQYKIAYRKGVNKRVGDALSRRPHTTTSNISLLAISICNPTWFEDIKASYATNPAAQAWVDKHQNDPDPKGRFSLANGILYFHGRI